LISHDKGSTFIPHRTVICIIRSFSMINNYKVRVITSSMAHLLSIKAIYYSLW
jgi:hypothetical protein